MFKFSFWNVVKTPQQVSNLSKSHQGCPGRFCLWYWSAAHRWSFSTGTCKSGNVCLDSAVLSEKTCFSLWQKISIFRSHCISNVTILLAKHWEKVLTFKWYIPLSLSEFIIFLVFLIRVEVENALNEMLGKHERALFKQEVNQAVLAETKQ